MSTKNLFGCLQITFGRPTGPSGGPTGPPTGPPGEPTGPPGGAISKKNQNCCRFAPRDSQGRSRRGAQDVHPAPHRPQRDATGCAPVRRRSLLEGPGSLPERPKLDPRTIWKGNSAGILTISFFPLKSSKRVSDSPQKAPGPPKRRRDAHPAP